MVKPAATLLKSLVLGITLLVLAQVSTPLSADIFSDLLGRCPASPPTYNHIAARLQALANNPRCSVAVLGKTPQGRPLYVAQVTDPASTQRQATLFIIASQHGNEPAGATAALILLEHFAAAPTTLEREILKYLRIVAVPVANPDGFASGRRGNSRGVDLNRDWSARSQPETQMVVAAVRAAQPDAIMDLHELPAHSGKPAYQDNFVETIGMSRSLPTELCHATTAVSSTIASWMKTYGYSLNVYFDYPGDNLALCHRYFGLGLKVPTFLCEAKRGGGRTLRERVGFLILSTLVSGNYVMNHSVPLPPSPPTPSPSAPSPSQPSPPVALASGPSTETPVVAVEYERGQSDDPDRGQLRVRVTSAPSFEYVTVCVGGQMRALGNSLNSTWPLDVTSLPAGRHRVTVTAFGRGDVELASRDITVEVGSDGGARAR